MLIVDNVVHNFAPRTPETEALAEVMREDLPPDATQIRHGTQNQCRTWIYQSADLGRIAAGRGLGKWVSVTLFSPLDDSQMLYQQDDVVQAIETFGDDPSASC